MYFRRLFVVAGSRGCGKSSFLENPFNYIVKTALPKELAGAANKTSSYQEIRALSRPLIPRLTDLWVHIDLNNILNDLSIRPKNESVDQITPRMIEDWAPMKALKMASELHVVTMLVSGPVAFQRLADRELAKDNELDRLCKDVYGSAPQSELLYRQLYESWYTFTKTLGAKSSWTLLGNKEPYEFLPDGAYSLIDES